MCDLQHLGCGHCKKMKPEYDEAAKILNKGAEVGFLCLHVRSMHVYTLVCFVHFSYVKHSGEHAELHGCSGASLTDHNNPSSWPGGLLANAADTLVGLSCSPALDVFLVSRACSSPLFSAILSSVVI